MWQKVENTSHSALSISGVHFSPTKSLALKSRHAQILRTLGRCRLDIDPTKVSDRYLIDVDPMVFVYWAGVFVNSKPDQRFNFVMVVFIVLYWTAIYRESIVPCSPITHSTSRSRRVSCDYFGIHRFKTEPLMMTSSKGNNFRVTSHLCGEFTGDRWNTRTKASDAELLCFPWSAPE